MLVRSFVRITPISRASVTARFPEGRLRAAGQANSISSVAVTLPNSEGGFWRSFEGNRQHKVRSFVQPGEPLALDRAESSALFGPANAAVVLAAAPLAQADCGSESAMSNERCIYARRLSVD
jgi:hypothetical protein